MQQCANCEFFRGILYGDSHEVWIFLKDSHSLWCNSNLCEYRPRKVTKKAGQQLKDAPPYTYYFFSIIKTNNSIYGWSLGLMSPSLALALWTVWVFFTVDSIVANKATLALTVCVWEKVIKCTLYWGPFFIISCQLRICWAAFESLRKFRDYSDGRRRHSKARPGEAVVRLPSGGHSQRRDLVGWRRGQFN